MYFHDSATREPKTLMEGIRARTFWGEKILMAVVDLDANALLPTHSHPHEQVSYILAGELEVHIGDDVRWVKAGEILVIPGNVPHMVKVGPQPAQVLDTFSPVREEFKY